MPKKKKYKVQPFYDEESAKGKGKKTPKKRVKRAPNNASKYNPNVTPFKAEELRRMGFAYTEIAEKLNVSYVTFMKYRREYKDFEEALQRGDLPNVFEVENALLKAAKGYEYEETTKEVIKNARDGKIKSLKIKTVTKQVQPNVQAALAWLQRYKSEFWKDIKHIDIKTGNKELLMAPVIIGAPPDKKKLK